MFLAERRTMNTIRANRHSSPVDVIVDGEDADLTTGGAGQEQVSPSLWKVVLAVEASVW